MSVNSVWQAQYFRAPTPNCFVFRAYGRGWSILCGRRNSFVHRRQIVLLFAVYGGGLVNSVWQAQYFRAPTPDCIVIYSTWRVVDLEGHFGGSKSIY